MSFMTHARNREDILEFVLLNIPTPTKPSSKKNEAMYEHLTWGIICLQIISRVLTNMLHDTHPWFSRARDKSLNVSALFARVPRALVKAAATNEETWTSDEMEAHYWPVLLRMYLSGGDVVKDQKHPLAYISMSFRFKVLGPLLIRLLSVIDDAMVTSADVRKNTVVQTTRKLLAGILREKKLAPFETTDNQDPKNVVAHHLHKYYFAGALDDLENVALKTLDSVIGRIFDKFGKRVAETVHVAALKAGRAQIRSFESFEGTYADGSDTLARTESKTASESSEISDVAYKRPQDPVRIMYALPFLDMLNDAMYRYMHLVDDEAMFDYVINEHVNPLELRRHKDVFPSVPVHEMKYKFGK